MKGEQARERLATVLVDTGADVDETVREVLDELDHLRQEHDDEQSFDGQPPVAVHDCAEFLAWLKS